MGNPVKIRSGPATVDPRGKSGDRIKMNGCYAWALFILIFLRGSLAALFFIICVVVR